jgi:hypothetical protein
MQIMKVCSLTCLLHLFLMRLWFMILQVKRCVVKYDTINSLKISDLTAGIYFIKFKGDAKTINTKFIIV